MRITVFGGTGFIGHHLTAALLDAGHRVRVAARRPAESSESSDIAARSGDRLEQVQADILEPETVRAAMTDANLVINLVGAILLPSERAYFELHERGAGHVAESARASGRTRLVHFSALGISPGAPSAADRSKAAGEAAVREVCPGAVVLRPSLVFGERDHFVSRLERLSRTSPVVPLIGARTRVQPVYVGDLVEGVVRLAHDPARDGQVVQAVGPQVYSLRDVVELFLAARGRRLVVGVPQRVARALGGAMECLPKTPLNRDFVDLMQGDKVAAANAPTLVDLNITPRGFESWLAAAGDDMRRG